MELRAWSGVMLAAVAAAGCRTPRPGDPDWPIIRSDEGDAVAAVASFAGAYEHSIGGRTTLRIRADGRYGLGVEGSWGASSNEEGDVRPDGDWLVIAPDGERRREWRALAVAWGGRTYLLAENEVLEFCNRVNAGVEGGRLAHGSHATEPGEQWLFFVKNPDRSVEGTPALPEAWTGYLLPAPLTGQIGEVITPLTVRVTLGSRHGIREGMRLYVEAEKGRRPPGVVTKVSEGSCEIELGEASKGVLLEVGMTVRSRR
jgi:hypothetical protein